MSVSTTSSSSAYKKTILYIGIGFFVAILLLTFFSGTLNNIALAKVSVVSPTSNSLQKVITANGAFTAKQIVNVNLDVAGKVDQVMVTAGDVVKKGDTLVKMDMSDLQSQITTEQNNLTKMLNNRAKSQLTVAPDYTQQNVQIANDKQAVTDAQAAYDTLKAQVAPPAAQADIDQANKKLTDAKNALKVAQDSLSHQKKQDANSKKGSAIDLKNTDMDIQTERNKITTMQTELADNTEIKAAIDGRIQSVNVQAGAQAGTAQPILTMLDTAKGLSFTVDVSNDNAALMSVGDQTDIHLEGSTSSVGGAITAIENSTASPGEMMTITLDANTQDVIDNDVQPNQKGDIRYSVNTDSYNMTLPNSAVREDSTGYFVLVVQSKKTPLGSSLVLSRVDVTVQDSDSYRTAVAGGVSQRDQVVSNSDKTVADGDTVRMAS